MKALREEKVHQRKDERILGEGDFVGRVLASAEEAMEKRRALRARGVKLAFIASRVSQVLGVKPEEVWAEGRYRRIVETRPLRHPPSPFSTPAGLSVISPRVFTLGESLKGSLVDILG